MMRQRLLLLLIVSLILVACGGGEEATPSPVEPEVLPTQETAVVTETPEEATEPVELTMMSHDSFAIGEEVLAQFEQAHNARVVLLPAGDAGAALNQAILAKDNPLADVFFGVDNTFMSRALAADIFEPYESPLLAQVPDELELDDSYRLLPVDYGDVCLNYDKAWFAEQGLEPPQTLRDLANPAYQGLTVVENPATSSPGLAFLLATVAAFGTEGAYTYLDYWEELAANDVLVTDGWEDAYFGQFSATSDGDRPVVVSYASSPPAEVVFADPPIDEPPTAAVTGSESCFRQVEFVGILKDTAHRETAEAFIDFMLDVTFQEDVPLNMFV
ncbi:MAG: thiamine ABC transporter substrate-binding protein, partial [Chloroflexi bacterium]|nr:thiamine ABC transporter substrate-binding protein [Chloroflexota bacterium]